jgi:hypothetical protein
MTPEVFDKQSQIHEIFETMSALDEVEWIAAISDDHNPNVCPYCGGFQSYKYDPALEDHRPDCKFVSVRTKLFKRAVSIASSIPDGNTFINLVTGLYLKQPLPKFG